MPGFVQFEDSFDARAPLGWDVTDAEPVARACVALLSTCPETTDTTAYVDGGFNAVGV